MPKLILLEGFAGSGKTTIAERYASEHPLTMHLEEDKLIVMFGQWLAHEDEARKLVFSLAKTMIATCLESGRDTIVPYLPTHPDRVKAFEDIAQNSGAGFFEVILEVERKDAIRRLMQRGSWGEEGTEPITDADLPIIENLHDTMSGVLEQRHAATRIACVEGDHEGTYQKFLEAIR